MNAERNITAPPAMESRLATGSGPSAFGLAREQLPLLVAAAGLSITLALIAVYINSFLALFVIGAGLLCVVAVVKPQMTTVFISFALYVNLPVVAIRFGGIPPAIAGSIFLALALPMMHSVLVRRQPIIINGIFLLMTAYFGLLLLSAALSRDVTLSFERLLAFGVEGYILYFLFINTIRTPQTLKLVVWALILGGLLMGSLSMIQEITGNYENEFFGLAQTKDDEVTVGETSFLNDKPTAHRLAGPIGSKNRYAQIMLVLVPLAITQAIANRNAFLRLLAAVSLVPIIAGVLLTYSRGAGLTLIALLVAMVFLRVLPLWKTILFGAAAALLIVIFLPGFAYRFSSVTEVTALFSDDVDEADGAIRGRATVNLVGLQIIMNNPILGVGPGQSPLYTREIGNEVGFRYLETDRRLHNMYLEEGADTGLIGLGMFLAIVAMTLYQLNTVRMRWRGINRQYEYLALALMLGIFAYLASAVFLHLSYVRYYWFLLALAGATSYILLRIPGPAANMVEGSARR